MAHAIYEDALYTAYDDGTEEVRFTDAEWAMMLDDPATFGLCCENGHWGDHTWREQGICIRCEVGPPSEYYDESDKDDRIDLEKRIRCGHCGGRHRIVDAVKACAGLLR